MTDIRQKVFIIKGASDNGCASGNGERKLDALRLRHPKSGHAAAFLLDTESKDLLEVQIFDDSPRSWFVGSTVETDGQLHVCSPFEPLFIVLHYIRKSKYAEQLAQLLTDCDFPDVTRLLSAVDAARLALIAERKGDAELQAFRYSEERTLAWLERKTRRLAALLETRGLHGTSGKADNFVKVNQAEVEKEAYLQYAWGITSEYVCGELSAALRQRLALPDEKVKRAQEPPAQPAAKRPRAGAAPLEDYTQTSSAAKKPLAPQNAKQKALAKSAVGTKSIASFFKKK